MRSHWRRTRLCHIEGTGMPSVGLNADSRKYMAERISNRAARCQYMYLYIYVCMYVYIYISGYLCSYVVCVVWDGLVMANSRTQGLAERACADVISDQS